MPPTYRTVSLDDIERVPAGGTLTWLPVRHTLGITAFGTNAYVADAAGDEVVEPHTEGESGHQELYFVARGAATFTLDGETVEAPAGTYVFLPDPAVHRHATAREPGTTVLSFGARAGEAFTVSAWEGRFRANGMREEDPEGARVLLEEALAAEPENGWSYYDLACWHARFGDRDEALRRLERAIELKGDGARDAAREDGDFDALRGDERFRALVG
jgi:quercetin dioxygenase-like cupin family protein